MTRFMNSGDLPGDSSLDPRPNVLLDALFPSAPGDRPRLLSAENCQAVADQLTHAARNGGYTIVAISSQWTGVVRWARNRISAGSEIRNNQIDVLRNVNGAENCRVLFNDTSQAGLVAAVRRAERLARLVPEAPRSDLLARFQNEPVPPSSSALFSEATYQLDAEHQAVVSRALAKSAEDAGMLSAGDIEVTARCMAMFDTLGQAVRFVKYTNAIISVSVRDPQGTGSGWAGIDSSDWSKIDAAQISAIALDKCLKSRNPVAIEPGRYTTILEPQAVCDMVSMLLYPDFYLMNQFDNWAPPLQPVNGPFQASPHIWQALRERRVIDPRITITMDPQDPDLVASPFNPWGMSFFEGGWAEVGYAYRPETYHPVTWIENGVLKNLALHRREARETLWKDTGLPNNGSFRMSGGTTSIDEMIASTERGVLVTRFDNVGLLDQQSTLLRGYTRDGLWLIEHGKISKAVKNMAFTESVLFMLNNVNQLGVPQRVLHTRINYVYGFGYIPEHLGDIPQPVIVPPLKVSDFSFTSLTDAV